ncbi:MAG: thioredoxin fold domain-containing protein [Puniceicoccales bacterium]|jgi:nucleoredoxin|nr:thioredoxin fold domain-containing protein [Puniceicoccales bacterium]
MNKAFLIASFILLPVVIFFASLAFVPRAFSVAGDEPADVAPLAAASAANGTGQYHAALLDSIEGAVINARGEADVAPLRTKPYLFIYFSASWCPPCRKFTPELVAFYNKYHKDGDFDLLFVSRDRNQEAMDSYMKGDKMPWTGLKLGSTTTHELVKKYNVRGIPCLVLLDGNDNVIGHSFEKGEYRGPDNALLKYAALKKTNAAAAK